MVLIPETMPARPHVVSDRYAIVVIDAGLLVEAAKLLGDDPEIEVVGSREGTLGRAQPCVRLVIKGDRLPVECETPGRLRTVLMECISDGVHTQISGFRLFEDARA